MCGESGRRSDLIKTIFSLSIDASSGKPCFEIPTIREYFMDLDYVLSVISDGPTKSYAYRRLKYLSGKFSMYTLLNEDEETSEMKVCACILPLSFPFYSKCDVYILFVAYCPSV